MYKETEEDKLRKRLLNTTIKLEKAAKLIRLYEENFDINSLPMTSVIQITTAREELKNALKQKA